MCNANVRSQEVETRAKEAMCVPYIMKLKNEITVQKVNQNWLMLTCASRTQNNDLFVEIFS